MRKVLSSTIPHPAQNKAQSRLTNIGLVTFHTTFPIGRHSAIRRSSATLAINT